MKPQSQPPQTSRLRFGVPVLIALMALLAVMPAARAALVIDGYTNVSTGTFNLTALGTMDWTHWGGWNGNSIVPGFDHMSGANLISDISATDGGPVVGWNGFAAMGDSATRSYTWTNGTVQTTETDAPVGVQLNGGNLTFSPGLSFTVDAGLDARTLNVFTGGWNTTVKFTAALSSGASVSDTWISSGGAARNGYYTVSFTGLSESDVLTITITNENQTQGNLTIQAATLVPEPTAASLLIGAIGTVLMFRRRRTVA